MHLFDGPFDCDVIMKKCAKNLKKCYVGPLAIRQLGQYIGLGA